MVVSPKHQGDVLQGHDQGKCPDHQRQDSEHIVRGEIDMPGREDLLDRVQHAGANIAIHHTDCAERKRGQATRLRSTRLHDKVPSYVALQHCAPPAT